MKPVTKRKATGVLAQLLAENRETELMRTRKRMMLADGLPKINRLS